MVRKLFKFDVLVTQLEILTNKYFSFHWLVSPKYDLSFFSGSVLVSPFLFGIYYFWSQLNPGAEHRAALFVYMIYAAILDYPHIMQTFSRTHKDKLEYNRHKKRINYSLVIIFGLTILAGITGHAVAYYGLINLFGIWHLLRQNIGFLRAYNLKDKLMGRFDKWIEEAMYYAIVAHLFFHNSESIEILASFGIRIQDDPLWMDQLEQLSMTLFISFFCFFVTRQIQGLSQGVKLNAPKLIFLGATLLNYCFYGMMEMPLLVFLALETSYHDIQYHGFIRQYQKQRYPEEKNVVKKWFSVCFALGLVAGILEILGGGEELGVPFPERPWVDLIFASFVLYHYYIDGVIWKFRESPEIQNIFISQQTPLNEDERAMNPK